MFKKNMSIVEMNTLINKELTERSIEFKVFLDEADIEDLKIFVENYKLEKGLSDIELLDAEKEDGNLLNINSAIVKKEAELIRQLQEGSNDFI